MEEDIKYLQRFIDKCKKCGSEFHGILKQGHFESLQNLINKNKELEKMVELMADCVRCIDFDVDICCERNFGGCKDCMIDYFRKKAKGE